jgi:aldehyde dehydrogenase family 7 protein A1
MAEVTFDDYPFLSELGLEKVSFGCFHGQWSGNGSEIPCLNPTTGKTIGLVKQSTVEELETCLSKAEQAKHVWMNTPTPVRGEIIRQIGEALRAKKEPLGKLVSLVMGKILSEGLGEIQEFIDICDYALGLSRQLEGKILPSERAKHVLMEVWNPLGVVGVISAFNFPAAVYGWNLAIALVCGNCVIWKGASSTSLISVAVTRIISEVFVRNGYPEGIITMVVGPGGSVGEALMADHRVRLLSFTGSTSIGRHVSRVVHDRFGRTILELGGNNAAIVMDDADVEIALRSCVFAAVGTAGQRCTSLRRLLLHESLYDSFKDRLLSAYNTVKIGDPLDSSNLMGPLHTKAAVKEFTDGIETIKSQGGVILRGGKVIEGPGFFVEPTIVEINHNAPIVKEELFVPILYLLKFSTLEEAISINNEVPQGLSSGLFTMNMRNMWQWLGPNGSDCGLVNVNMATSGAEIGGAFGGEKETGEGRESGSDSWKQYMRRSTCAINFSTTLSLAQGVQFNIS